MKAAWSRAWSASVGADVCCPPLVYDHRVFVRAGQRIIVLVDGVEDWNRRVGLGLGHGERLVAVAGGVATDDVADGHTTVVAFDTDGQARWRVVLDGVTTDAGCTPDQGTAWWLVVEAGKPRLHVVDAISGETWSARVPVGSSFGAATARAVFVAAPPVVGADRGLVRVDLEQRTQRRVSAEGIDAVVASEERVFAVDGDGAVTCHDAATGAALWRRDGFGLYLAVAAPGLLTVSEDDSAWSLVEPDSGAEIWSQRVEPLQVCGVALGQVAILIDLLEAVVAEPEAGEPICTLGADDEMTTQAGQAGLGAGLFVAAFGSTVVGWSAR